MRSELSLKEYAISAPASTQLYPGQQKRSTWSGGRFALVLLRAVFAVLTAVCLTGGSDGSWGVHADTSVGATLPIVTTRSLWLLVASGVRLLIAIALFVAAVARRRN